MRPSHSPILTLETKIGLAVAMVLISTVAMCAWLKFTNEHSRIPLHIQNAPIAKHVGPDYYLRPLDDSPKLSPTPPERQTVSSSKPNHSISFSRQRAPEQPKIAQPKIASVASPPNIFKPKEQTPKLTVAAPPLRPNLVLEAQTTPAPAIAPSRDLSHDFVATKAKSESGLPLRVAKQERPGIDSSKTSFSNTLLNSARKLNQLAGDLISKPAANDPGEFGQVSFEQEQANDFAPANTVDLANANEELPSTSKRVFINSTAKDDAELKPLEVTDSTSDSTTIATQPELQFAEKKSNQIEFKSADQKQYVVVANDSFWTIAQEQYEDGRYFKALYEFNRSRVDAFDKLKPDDVLEIPELSQLKLLFADLCPVTENAEMNVANSNAYVTQDGDTLFDIARRVTGQASDYLEIIRLNRKELPADVNHLTRLAAGIRLQLPKR